MKICIKEIPVRAISAATSDVTIERVELTMPDGRTYLVDGWDFEVWLARARTAIDDHRISRARAAYGRVPG